MAEQANPVRTDLLAGRRWVSLVGICTAAGMVWLAFADLGVASPPFADELHGTWGVLQWANNAFSLVTGAPVIAADKLIAVRKP